MLSSKVQCHTNESTERTIKHQSVKSNVCNGQVYNLFRKNIPTSLHVSHLLRNTLLVVTFISAVWICFTNTSFSRKSISLRRRLESGGKSDKEYYIESLNDFPPLIFTHEQLEDWAWILCFCGMIYFIIGIDIICSDYFVPAIEVIADKYQISEDIAGATWLAIGTSAPELFTCFIGTFVAQSDIGFGTIVGSAIFNVGLILGACAIFSAGDLKIGWWPFSRDMLYLLLSLGAIALFFGGISKNEIYWWESLILLLLYVLYVILMKHNESIRIWFINKYVPSEKKSILSEIRNSEPPNGYGTGTSSQPMEQPEPHSVKSEYIITPFPPPQSTVANASGAYENLNYKTPSFRPRFPSFEPSEQDLELQDLSPADPKLQGQFRNTKPILSYPKHDGPSDNRTSTLLSINQSLTIKGTGGGDYFIRELSQTNLTAIAKGTKATGQGVDLSFPQGKWQRFYYIIQAPLKWCIYYTVIDVTRTGNETRWPYTFIVCILWLAGLSYLMVWLCVLVGFAWLVPQEIMGLVFLAFGTSLPELITCVIVARIGKADMAICGAVASNILNILVGLPLPWLSMSIIMNAGTGRDMKMDVQATGLFISILVLIVMMGVISALIYINKWILKHWIGWAMIGLYVLFVVQDLIRHFLLDINL